MIAAGVAVFLVDVARNFRLAITKNAGNVWNAPTLEWLPTGNYSVRSVPIVESSELWDRPAARGKRRSRPLLSGSPRPVRVSRPNMHD